MLESLPDHYQTQFADNWEHLLQQGDSRLEGKCRRANIDGKERQFSQLGKSKMRLITTRNGKTIASDTPMAKRWVRPQGYDEVTYIDEFDHIALGELPAARQVGGTGPNLTHAPALLPGAACRGSRCQLAQFRIGHLP